MGPEFFDDDGGGEFGAHRRSVLLEFRKGAAHMFGEPLVDVARHLTDLHQGALHLSERLGDLLGRVHLELATQLLSPPCVGEDLTSAQSSIRTTRLRSERGESQVASGASAISNRRRCRGPVRSRRDPGHDDPDQAREKSDRDDPTKNSTKGGHDRNVRGLSSKFPHRTLMVMGR